MERLVTASEELRYDPKMKRSGKLRRRYTSGASASNAAIQKRLM